MGKFANARKYGLIMISHTKVIEKTVTKSVVERKVTFTTATLHKRALEIVVPLADIILYTFRDSEGHHLMRTKNNDNFLGGDRSGLLPEVMDLNYELMFNLLMKGE